jgi:RNA polymerase sigma-70 factor (ECF subfamily)
MTWSGEAFDELVDPHRHELLVHCYRMLGSIDDAEDAVQDTLVRAWRGRGTFRRAISFRAWLYRIATNVCLDLLEHRGRIRGHELSLEVEPAPDRFLEQPLDETAPQARIDARESVSLAFLTVLQLLPPRQRAILLLRDVLALRASEVADLLELSVPAANSSLQRARATMRRHFAPKGESARWPAPSGAQIRSLLDRYVKAWETADIIALVGLLREEALLAMPPRPSIRGADRIGAFLEAAIFANQPRRRLVPALTANGSPAFGAYACSADGACRAFALLVLEVDRGAIARIVAFTDPTLLDRFEIARALAE